MPSDILSKVDLPFTDHFIYTENNITKADVDRLLRPILEKYGVALNEYDPDNLTFKIGEKTTRLSVEDYKTDEDFEEIMHFGREPFDLKRAVFIKNGKSIEGTEILVDFVKSFQKEFLVSFFDRGGGAYIEQEEIQDLYIDDELFDPLMRPYMEKDSQQEVPDNEQ